MSTINAKRKKAISPVIAGIMLLAVALIAGLMVSTWSTTLVTRQTEKSPMCTLTTYYSIESAKYDLATGIIRAKITNRGKDDLYNFTIELDNGSITTITPFTPSSNYKLKQGRSILVKGHYPNLGNLNNIRVIPNSCPQKISQLKVNNIAISLDLVLNLHLDSVNGTNYTQDDSIYNNHGQLYNGASSCYNQSGCINLTTGKYGNALVFDGVDDYVDAGNDSSLDITSTITIEAWVNLDIGLDKDEVLVHRRDGGSTGYALVVFNKVEFQIWNTTGNLHYNRDVAGGTVLQNNTWYHLVGVYDGSKIKTYVNGILDREKDVSGAGVIGSTINSLFIGAWIPGNDYAEGTIDEVRIWNRALTADEIKELAS